MNLPRENIIRAHFPGEGLVRAADEDNGMPTLVGHFALFDIWTEINSFWEGRFLERITKGAFKKTFREKKGQIKTLFQHGRDPQVGDKPLGVPEVLGEDEKGAFAETPLLDTAYVREIIPGLEAGAYGQSFMFRVLREELVEEPGESDHNPQGLPERTIKEVELFEHGPVTWPAYADTDAGLRSLTDEYIVSRMVDSPDRLKELVEEVKAQRDRVHILGTKTESDDAAQRPDDSAEAKPHSVAAAAGTSSPTPEPASAPVRKAGPLYGTKDERPVWQL